MQTVVTKTIRNFFNDDRPLADENSPGQSGRLAIVGEKVMALAEAELDKKLRDLDVDPEEISKATTQKKRLLLRDAVSREVTRRAVASMGGIRVLATFEDLQHIGVLVVYSENMQQLGESIARGEIVSRANLKDPKESILRQIEEVCPAGATDLIDTFGVRVMTDDNGDPTVVAFCQWSPAIVKTDTRLRQNSQLEAARITARNLADGALTDFVNSTLVLESETVIDEIAQSMETSSGAGEVRVEDQERIGNVVSQTVKQYGRAKLAGVTSIKEWTGNHPEKGHLIVGHILMWSPATRDGALGKTASPAHKSRGGDSKGKVRTSRDFDKDADF